ncbi:hypothetical protein EVAR_88583_1 [Eumeta japonica]|uniref:Uncharacterized protein n=1 Tax=Eumeta variegata TaxID=151549 RepID=A0A4C1YAC3_EUMVA|nr:hypothetical protein EVAR_88583_1 [Eumeta japonica]
MNNIISVSAHKDKFVVDPAQGTEYDGGAPATLSLILVFPRRGALTAIRHPRRWVSDFFSNAGYRAGADRAEGTWYASCRRRGLGAPACDPGHVAAHGT